MGSRVVHFEIPSDNPENSIKFFKEAFNWNFQQFGNEQYWFAMTGEEKEPGINGAIMKKRDPRQPLVNAIKVADIEEGIRRVEQAGGRIVVAKTLVPNVGWSAYFTDPDGNIHGLWQDDASAK
jgi:predicted enzyme related to lactoylglutathione lyase